MNFRTKWDSLSIVFHQIPNRYGGKMQFPPAIFIRFVFGHFLVIQNDMIQTAKSLNIACRDSLPTGEDLASQARIYIFSSVTHAHPKWFLRVQPG
jgi:hypothetical protein